MRLAKYMMAVAACSLASAPALAESAASKLSVSNLEMSRASTEAGESNDLAPAVIIGVLATVAIIGGAVALADSNDDPDSN